MSTYFISDLHLNEKHQDSTRLFIKFLTERASKADALYILGDLWDAWIGDDSKSGYISDIKLKLKSIANKIPVFIMHGNRDFLIDKRFINDINCTLLPDPYIAKIYGKKIILSHGDIFCTDDKKYQKYRKFIRSPFINILIKFIPFSLRNSIAEHLRRYSKNHYKNNKNVDKNKTIFDVNIKSITTLMQKFKIFTIIHGHTHLPAVHSHNISDDLTAKRIVLGEWRQSAYVLRYSQSQDLDLECFS